VLDLSGSGWVLWQDQKAEWQNDELFLPPVDLARLPTNPPTGGWESLSRGIPVAVPGTVEEYLGQGQGPDAQTKGVSWWTRSFRVPDLMPDSVLRLEFDAVRLRAEVYVNGRLVAYDLVGNAPFGADLTPLLRDGSLRPGAEATLAVRVTNPGGNCDWKDFNPIPWGKHLIPISHGFSGITGGVKLVATAPLRITDIYLQNTPKPCAINAVATVRNDTGSEKRCSMQFVIREKGTGATLLTKDLQELVLHTGENMVSAPLEVPDAKLWDPDHPNLHTAEVTVVGGGSLVDSVTETFGFRWFAPEGGGSDAVLRLNGKRIVLRTAISWGFWPINGIFPTPELAERQIRVAKAFGLNMLNFHRCIGNPLVFQKADETGLLYFEEPGGYVSAKDDPFAQALSREKLLRMVRRDRNHPSLVIYNMINEQWDSWGAATKNSLLETHRRDLIDAHALDPSRTILYTSAWAGRAPDPSNDPAKMHIRPFESTVRMNGWYDFHRAGGRDLWRQEFYRDPEHHHGHTTNTGEIVYWGEEGAVSTPPRLGLIERELKGVTNLGWDGQVYRDWHAEFDSFLTSNNLRGAFPTVDDLCQAMGVVGIEHQGRKIEDTRICNPNDGYAINGWESEVSENHSGVVDCFRNPKADPAILAYYNKPLYVAVKPRLQVVTSGSIVPVDFHLINELDLKGSGSLLITARDPDGKLSFSTNLPVRISGGEVYGESLASGVAVPVRGNGFTAIDAEISIPGDAALKVPRRVAGHDRVFATECDSVALSTNGAVLERGNDVISFLRGRKGISVPRFDDSQPRLDWLLVAKSAVKEPEQIPHDAFRTLNDQPGITVRFYDTKDLSKPLLERVDATIDLNVPAGASPDPRLPLIGNYTVIWEGKLLPPADGEYLFRVAFRHGVRVLVDGRMLADEQNSKRGTTKDFKVALKGGKAIPIRLELSHKTDDANVQLRWQTPLPETVSPEQVLTRAYRDGTTVVIADRAETWLGPLGKATGIPQGASFPLGRNWVGGQYFVKDHPIFRGLPVNQALNWPYQGVVEGNRTGLQINGGELVAGAYRSWPMKLGSAVSVIPLGKGRVILSSLDVVGQLNKKDSPSEVARRLLCNMIRFGATLP